MVATSTWIVRRNPTRGLIICAPDSRTGGSEIIADGLQRSRQPRERGWNIRLSPMQNVPARYWIYPPSVPSEVARPLVFRERDGIEQIACRYCVGRGIFQP